MALDMNGYIMNKVRYGDRQAVADQKLWESLPDFEYVMPGASWVLHRQPLALAVLSAWFAGCFLLAVWRAKKVTPV